MQDHPVNVQQLQLACDSSSSLLNVERSQIHSSSLLNVERSQIQLIHTCLMLDCAYPLHWEWGWPALLPVVFAGDEACISWQIHPWAQKHTPLQPFTTPLSVAASWLLLLV